MREGEFAMGMVVAMPMGRAAVSVTPRNLIRLNPFNPRTLREAVLAGVAGTTAPLLGISQLLGFVLAFTVLIARPVSRDEALVLHKAWQIAKFDRTFTLCDVLAVASDLQDDYLIEKVSKSDILSYLNNLELAGAIAPTSSGYRLVEEVKFPFGVV
jgi:hypothetical protein